MIATILLCSVLFVAEPNEAGTETAKLQFQAKVCREDSRIRFEQDGTTSVWDITSKTGIGHIILTKLIEKWPEKIVVRMHMKGLEFFQVTNDNLTVRWSVSNSRQGTLHSLWQDNKESTLPADSPFYTDVKIVSKDGYFEVPLPSKMFEKNPKEIRLDWIDFYRQ